MGDFQASTTVDADANTLFDCSAPSPVQQGLEETLATVKQLVEQQAAAV
jgi:hypothetical protein